jgi:hypothetical protein
MTPSSAPPINKAELSGAYPGTSIDDLQPQGISEKTTIIIASALTAAIIMATVIGSIHCFHHRRRRQVEQKRQQQDIERSLQRARRPVLTLDTDIPRANEFMRSAGRPTLPNLSVHGDVVHPPLVQIRTAPPNSISSRMGALGAVRARSATRTSSDWYPPGVAGRNTMRPINQDGRFGDIGQYKARPIYNI